MWKPQFRANDQLPPIGLGFIKRGGMNSSGSGIKAIWWHFTACFSSSRNRSWFCSFPITQPARRARRGPSCSSVFRSVFSIRAASAVHRRAAQNRAEGYRGHVSVHSPRRQHHTQAVRVAGQSHAKLDKDGVLHIDKSKDLRGHPFGWKPIGPDLWQQVDDQGKLFAIRAADGRIERLAGSFAAAQLQRVPWYEQDRLVFLSLGVSSAGRRLRAVQSPAAIWRGAICFAARNRLRRPDRVALSALPKTAIIYWLLLLSRSRCCSTTSMMIPCRQVRPGTSFFSRAMCYS